MIKNGFEFKGKDYMGWDDIQDEFDAFNSNGIKICELIRDHEDVYVEFILLDVEQARRELDFLTDKEVLNNINEGNLNQNIRFSFDNCKEIIAKYYKNKYNFGDEFVVTTLEASESGVGIIFDFMEIEKLSVCRKIQWGFDEKCLQKAIDGIKTNLQGIGIGQVQIGDLMVDFVLREDTDENSVLDYDVYIGGLDAGYGYTEKNKIPYDYCGGGTVINSNNIDDFTSISKFKEITIKEINEYINSYKDQTYINSRLLKDKADKQNVIDWK